MLLKLFLCCMLIQLERNNRIRSLCSAELSGNNYRAVTVRTFGSCCLLIGDYLTGYNWDNTGMGNSNTYTKTISASDISSQAEPSQTFAPTLKVTNADGAEADISCSSVAAFVTATSPVTVTNGSMAILGPGKTYVVDISCPSWRSPTIKASPENGNNYNYSGPPPVSGIIESDAGETREFSMYRGDRQYLPFTTSSTVDYTTYTNFTGLIYLSNGYVDLLCY